MAELQLQGIRKRHGALETLRGIDLHIASGELVVFVGPSGCGKSTLLRLIAGLDLASAGRILIAGRDCTEAPASARGCAMVFQQYALYPHMTVRANLEFGLRMRRTPRGLIDQRRERAVAMLKLEPYLERKPAELSGGQAQRVAIGRALMQDAEVYLFDEPLSNLDAELRQHMRVEIATLHQRLRKTMVYVTHDQVEAMTLAERIVVLRDGRIEQVGSPMELYERPANVFVAGFIGAPAMNLWPVAAAHWPASLPAGATTIGVRPEHLELVGEGGVEVELQAVERLGATSYLYGRFGEHPVCAELRADAVPRPGERVRLAPRPGRVHGFDAQGQRCG